MNAALHHQSSTITDATGIFNVGRLHTRLHLLPSHSAPTILQRQGEHDSHCCPTPKPLAPQLQHHHWTFFPEVYEVLSNSNSHPTEASSLLWLKYKLLPTTTTTTAATNTITTTSTLVPSKSTDQDYDGTLVQITRRGEGSIRVRQAGILQGTMMIKGP